MGFVIDPGISHCCMEPSTFTQSDYAHAFAYLITANMHTDSLASNLPKQF